MLIRVGYDITYNFPAPTDIILMLYIHPSRGSSILVPEHTICDPAIFMDQFMDLYRNRGHVHLNALLKSRIIFGGEILDRQMTFSESAISQQSPV